MPISSMIGAASARAFGLFRTLVTPDTYFKYVTMLIPGNGATGAQNNTFLDGSTNNFTITRNGNTTQGTFTPYGTLWSNYFLSQSGYIGTATSANLASGTSSFTMEFWYLSTINANGRPCGNGNNDAWGANKWVFANQATGKIEFFVNNYNSATAMFSSTSTTVAYDGQWHHVVISRSGNTWAMFIDGTRQGAAVTSSVSLNGTTSTINVGWSYLTGDTSAAFNGYISNFRFVNGTAVYDPTLTTLTVPTAPLTAISGTAFLSCQSSRFVDNSTNAFAITATGTPSVQRFSPFNVTSPYGATSIGGSGYFDGTGDSLTAANNTALQLGSTYTAEAWVYPLAFGTNLRVWSDGTSSSVNNVDLYVTSTGGVGISGGAATISTANTIKLNSWAHVAVVSNAGALALYVNGVSQTLTGTTTGYNSTSTATRYVGSSTTASTDWNGYISNVRFLKNTAQYTANFTPPTAPLTAITNTQLLLSLTNAAAIDNAMMGDFETVGDAKISSTQSKWGGSSLAFDGTGDWLTAAQTINQQFGARDFTIEGWFYLNTTGIAQGIVSKGTATTGWSVNVTSGNKLQFSYTATALTGATTLTSGVWYYFAVVRSGSATGNLKIYLNGTADATSGGAVTDNFNQTSIMYVGADRVGTSAMNGYVDDLRITRGYARTITASPTTPFATYGS